ncbi:MULTISPECIES: ABC transporter substrate-binding protein [Oceanotoga]|uniref:Carbohydrate ABC transporter substrate-binding protein (CUT1 family) n=1 Tax=Oceanotoga teriensis TaxID=515440 RepID=A0AA45C6G8_9BACT|nr:MULTISPECIES: ABC transporter substrate-binding protein [Oceanotoga]MDN5341996.1 multiple sugar transport system substrate-binding protein [Oceanotoga sp.]MDO7976045.1 ABC transporter substrate-binding protein [Oceanotoga teriensis]PWJ92090.1 carbohydrate ABC transporter substrate-binding protein (CUT1 family) [Oceanotoga teriensis]
MKKGFFVVLILLFGIICFTQKTIVMSGWPGNPVEESIIKNIIEKFNAQNPDIKAVWQPAGDVNQFTQKLMSEISAGSGPDIFYVDVAWAEEFYKINALYPLDLFIKKESFDIEDFFPNLLDAFTFDNKLYSIPKDASSLNLFYNKEFFDKYGVEYPTNNDTWFDLFDKATQLKNKGMDTPLVIAADFNRAIPFIFSAGGEVVNEDLSTAITSNNSWAGFKFYVELVSKYNLAVEPSALGASWIGEAYGTGKVAMAMTGNWTVGYLREQYPDLLNKTGIVNIPHFSEKSSMLYTVGWSINKYSKNKQESWELIKFLTDEGQKEFVEKVGSLSSRKSIASKDTDNIKKIFYDALDFAHPWKVQTPSGRFTRANDELNSILKDLFYNHITFEEAKIKINENYMKWVK